MASTLDRVTNGLRRSEWRRIGSALLISIPLAVVATVLVTVVLQSSSGWILPLAVILFAVGLHRKRTSRGQLGVGLLILAIESGLLPIAILLYMLIRGGISPPDEVVLGGWELLLVVTIIAWPIGLALVFLARRLGGLERGRFDTTPAAE